MLARYAAGDYFIQKSDDALFITILNMVANRKVDNISKPIESTRSDNHIINNCWSSLAKLFREIVWGIECK